MYSEEQHKDSENYSKRLKMSCDGFFSAADICRNTEKIAPED